MDLFKLKAGVFIYDNTVIDLTKATMPTNHPLMICDDSSPQFTQTLLEMIKTPSKDNVLMRDVNGFVTRNITYDDCLVVYKQGETITKTFIHPVTNKSIYSSRTKDDYLKNGFIVDTWENICVLIKEAEDKKYLNSDFKEITEEEFNYGLEVLPPENWIKHQHGSIFRMSEYMTSNITGHYVKHRNKFFYALRRNTTSYDDIIDEVNLLFK